jgi:lipoic acid synthetase
VGSATDRAGRKPSWLKAKLPTGSTYQTVDRLLGSLQLNTVCSSARCPNLGDCWGRGTATFMILGNVCTRHCGFCAVRTGSPGGKVDATEPGRIAEAVAQLALRYVVITSVDRDDLPDLGAGQFACTIEAIRRTAKGGGEKGNEEVSRDSPVPDPRPLTPASPGPGIEVLIPDFNARSDLLSQVVSAAPTVLGHNLETVEELTPEVRDPRASYRTSLEVLRRAKELNPGQTTKSGIMVGLGETRAQVIQTMRDLRASQVDVVTIGQYLRPARRNLPVREYVTPEQFAEYARLGRELGFRAVFSAPLVRSSFHAEEVVGSGADPERRQPEPGA